MNYNIENLYKENLSFYKHLKNSELDSLINSSYIVNYKKGELVYSKTSNCLGVILVLNGQLKSFMSSNNREITVFRLFENDICIMSSSCFYPDLTYDIMLEAEEDSTILVIDGNTFKNTANNNVYVQNFFLKVTQDKLSEVMWVLEQVVFHNLESRLAKFILEQYSLCDSLKLELTHDTIANNLGTAREVISRLLKRFENDKIIKKLRGSIEIIDLEKLTSLIN